MKRKKPAPAADRKMPTPQHRGLTALSRRQQALARLAVARPDLSDTEIMRLAGYTGTKHGKDAPLKNPAVRLYMSQHLDDAGATLASSARVIAEAQNAREVKFFTHEGKVTDERVVVDHVTRLKAARLNGEYRNEFNQRERREGDWAKDLTDEQLAKVASGELDPATLMQTGDSRMRNPLASSEDDD